MATIKISGLPELTEAASGDLLEIVDVSEPVEADRSKRITVENLLDAAATEIGLDDLSDVSIGSPGPSEGDVLTFTGSPGSWVAQAPSQSSGATEPIGITIDGGGSAITTGIKGFFQVPYACTISAVRMFADQSGDCVIDIWKDTYANFPPTDADTITASAPPTLSSAQKSEDTTLTGWTKTITAGDILAYNVDSASTVTRVTLQLIVTRT